MSQQHAPCIPGTLTISSIYSHRDIHVVLKTSEHKDKNLQNSNLLHLVTYACTVFISEQPNLKMNLKIRKYAWVTVILTMPGGN